MRMFVRASLAIGVVALLISLGGRPVAAVPIDSPDYVWIYGQRISQTEACWGNAARPVLQIKRDGVWRTVARAKMTRSPACKKAKFRMRARYTFVLNDLGVKDPTGRTYTLEARTVSGDNKYPFTKTVYRSKADHVADLAASFNDLVTGPSGDMVGSSSPLTTGMGDSGWSGCSFNGVPLFGDVKIVSYGADFVVREVSFTPDLRVQAVTRPAFSCGEWRFVEFGEDFTVQVSKSGLGVDFEIQFVNAFPGR